MNIDPGWFCSPFDAHLAASGPPALFLLDAEQLLRFDAEWTRDAWGRAPSDVGPPRPCWGLARDRASGYVLLLFSTSPALLSPHPRLDFRIYPDRASAEAVRTALGRPFIDTQPWS